MREYTTFPSIRHEPDIARALAKHEGLVHWVVRRQWLGDLPYAEALHAGRIGLWRALQRYDCAEPLRTLERGIRPSEPLNPDLSPQCPYL
ncbi:TPA: hypothetical protein EYP12_00830 [Candidatus Bipolaricaulota bacterium]|nr:hypothetical protein [Candidatus Bipolaricaulota bacterium]